MKKWDSRNLSECIHTHLQSVVVADPLCVLSDLVVGEEVEGAVAAQAKDLPASHTEAPRVARRGHTALWNWRFRSPYAVQGDPSD